MSKGTWGGNREVKLKNPLMGTEIGKYNRTNQKFIKSR